MSLERRRQGRPRSVSAPTQSVQTQDVLSIGVSRQAETPPGTQPVNTGSRLVLVGSNGITPPRGPRRTLRRSPSPATPRRSRPRGSRSVSPRREHGRKHERQHGIAIRDVAVGNHDRSLRRRRGGLHDHLLCWCRVGGDVHIGNTSGTPGSPRTRLDLAGGNNITLSGSTNGGSMSITISAPNLGAGAMSAGVSNLGNTAGSTGITGTQMVLVGSDNITLSQTTGANGGTVSIIGTGGGGFSAGVSTDGNTAGDTGVTGTRLVFVGTVRSPSRRRLGQRRNDLRQRAGHELTLGHGRIRSPPTAPRSRSGCRRTMARLGEHARDGGGAVHAHLGRVEDAVLLDENIPMGSSQRTSRCACRW